MIKVKLDKVIRTIPDFPKDGVSFKDITPLLLDASLTNDIIDEFIIRLDGVVIDAFVDETNKHIYCKTNKLRVSLFS